MNGVNFHDEMVNNINIRRDLSLSRRETVIPREIIVSKEVFDALANNGCCPDHDAEIRRRTFDEVISLLQEYKEYGMISSEEKYANVVIDRVVNRLEQMKGE